LYTRCWCQVKVIGGKTREKNGILEIKNYEISNKKIIENNIFWEIFPFVFGQIYLLEGTWSDNVNSDVF
jgi:hypothetical protein